MAKVCRLYAGIVTALALCKYCLGEWNATEEPANRTVDRCHHHDNRDNCTDEWGGHFSECPEEFKHYCVHGECRYVEEQKTPSCRCQPGYVGSRCEYVDLDWQKGDRRQIIIACGVVGLLLLVLLIAFICFCSHRRYRLCWRKGRRREEPRNGSEKLSMMDTRAPHTAPTPDATEPPRTHAV